MTNKVLLIHTGGTIGMVRDSESGVLKPDLLYEGIVQLIPELHDIADIIVEIPFVLDSCDINLKHWQRIVRLILKYIDEVQGVVITHGTDTMAYTASALSFMLMNIPIPVILTGAQRPLCELRSDGRGNLINSVELATSHIKEVGIFFDHKLMRGNRTIKVHINDYDAFASPNYHLLAKVGMDIEIFDPFLLKPDGLFHIFSKMDQSIGILKLFPGCKGSYFQPSKQMRGIILMAFGAGSMSTSPDLMKRIKGWIDEGRVVVLISETQAGRLEPKMYRSGSQLLDIGVLDAQDMTFEACLTKLMFLLGQYKELSLIRKNFSTPLAGELTVG